MAEDQASGGSTMAPKKQPRRRSRSSYSRSSSSSSESSSSSSDSKRFRSRQRPPPQKVYKASSAQESSPMAKLVITAVAIATVVWFFRAWEHSPLPDLDPEEWWGPSELRMGHNTSVREFKVVFTREMIADLKHRLNNFRPPPPPLEGVAFQYGFSSEKLDSWRHFWAEKYNFTEREKFFNKYKNFKTNIQGLDIHFIRVKPKVPPGVTVVPILILHGWPGSVREFYELIPYLTTLSPGQDFVFEVIAPSLPGFGYSDAPIRPGFGGLQIAVIMRNLMHRLGHMQFYMQAGDWGGEVASDLATFFPEDVLGLHSNLVVIKHPLALLTTFVGAVFPKFFVDPPLEDRMNRFTKLSKESGYFHMQASKPDTIGTVLSDSPMGLLAYILEKVSAGTNLNNVNEPDGGLDAFTKEQLLDNLMMYWVPRTATTSLRIYRDGIAQILSQFQFNVRPTPVLTWVMQAEHEILYQVPSAIRFKFPNLVNVTIMLEGGHFIAFEKPEVLAKDVFTAMKSFRKIQNSSSL